MLAGDPIGEDDGALDDHDRRAPAHPAICRPANSCVATIWGRAACAVPRCGRAASIRRSTPRSRPPFRSEEHTSELQSLMRISYAVFCLKKKKNIITIHTYTQITLKHQNHTTDITDK